MNNVGAGSKPLWDTESSWADGTTDDLAYIAREHLFFWSQGVSRDYWYSYDSGGSTAERVAVNQVYNWMVGSTMTAPCSASGTVWSCGLTDSSGKTTRAVWNTAGPSGYTITAGTWADYKKLDGSTNTVSGGTTSVSIGVEPILLETAGTGTSPSAPTGLTATVQ